MSESETVRPPGAVTRFNEGLAVRATKIFGSMFTTYAFFAYGFLPVVVPAWMTALLYWSNTVQLWSLPLLMVGTAVLTRGTQQQIERLLQETHDGVMEELTLAKAQREATQELQRAQTEELALLRQSLGTPPVAPGSPPPVGSAAVAQ